MTQLLWLNFAPLITLVGVVTIVAMDAVKGEGGSYRPSIWLMLGILLLAIALSLVVSETFHRKQRQG